MHISISAFDFKSSVLSLVLAAVLVFAAACGGQSPEELMLSAQEMLESGDVYGAEMQLQRVIEDHPDSPEALEARQGLVFIYMNTQNLEGVEEQMDALVEASGGPQTEAGLMHLTQKLFVMAQQQKSGEVMAAIDETSRTLTNAPLAQRLRLASIRSGFLAQFRQFEEAREQALAVMEMAADAPELHVDVLQAVNNAFLAPEEGDLPSTAAMENLVQVHRQFLQEHPDSPANAQFHFTIGQLLETVGRDAEAEEAYRTTEAIFEQRIEQGLGSERVTAMGNLAGLYQRLNRLDDMRGTLERIIADFPGTEDAAAAEMTLAQMDHADGNMAAAQQRLQRLIAQNPQSQVALNAHQFLQLLNQEAASTQTQTQQPAVMPLMDGSAAVEGPLDSDAPATGALQQSEPITETPQDAGVQTEGAPIADPMQ